MKFINRDTDYALRALVYMARLSASEKKTIVTVDEIADRKDLPERFLRRILQRLAKDKILCSYKGQDGGFSFLKLPGEIRFVDIIEIFQGGIDFTNCVLKGERCSDIKNCSLRKKIREINLLVNKKLRGITIASLLKEEYRDGKEKDY